MELLLGKTRDQWSEWQVTFQMTVLTGFKQVNQHLDQIEDLIKDFKEEKTAAVKSQLKEMAELCVLRAIPDNIKGMMCDPVSYVAIAARKTEVKN